ncbi:uncharacterized membrane protein YhaH (DUF805 family) [Paenibacillus phyllosphaerae]|uniref:Uncharacterized membrane protein YhaH (DUF805 family) n=1 Tax=Paenibacillus phyllosphaerae TaxID=274593 RepID=A0A7W5FNC0_9BACL|nr:DUF805 domain-containing protein [Paenibacillus phyllosphaerae]MBB3111176.1 uncharacterized membrane protein YhaH (DUF805 family) [Paenibacillus phyllosphaerae]
MGWYVNVIRNYAGFAGRARRKEFWMFYLVNIIISILIGVAEAILGIESSLLSGLYGLFILLPSLALGARRLHDIGKSGWWLLIGLIPLIGGIVLFVFSIMEGDDDTNKYGQDPKLFA